jgi:hypothetical protein
MKKNIANWDRAIRFFTGVVIIVIGAYFKSVWGAIGVIPLFTAQSGTCPVYSVFGISTLKKTKHSC